MPLPPPRLVPEPLGISQALAQSEGLIRLGWLMRESTRRLQLVEPALPPLLRRAVQAGPVDEEGWSLLASNAAVAAKLRHFQPRLEALLKEAGVQPPTVRIRLLKG